MTFRHSPRKRLLVPAGICGLIGGIGISYQYLHLSLHLHVQKEMCTAGGALLAVLGLLGWIYWGEYVRVDDTGIQWKRVSTSGALKWEDLERIEIHEKGRVVLIGVIDRRTQHFHPLPLFPEELYGVLKAECGGLPRSVELRIFGVEVAARTVAHAPRSGHRCECRHLKSQHQRGETWHPSEGRYMTPCSGCTCRDFKNGLDNVAI